MENGEIGILNVGCGDTKISFDPSNPQERIRAARIVTDMIKRGYSLLVAVPGSDPVTYRRAYAFDENTCEYIIADQDALVAKEHDDAEEKAQTDEAATVPTRKGGRTKRVPAEKTRAVAVARTAGG